MMNRLVRAQIRRMEAGHAGESEGLSGETLSVVSKQLVGAM
jgi:hypothetical protein